MTEEVATGVAETIEEAAMTDAVEITEAAITAETIPTIVIGSALSVKTLISHSELNVIDVESPKVPVHLTSSATIEAAEMTAVEETTVAVEMIEGEEMTAEIIAVTIQTTIGIVLNVTTLTSHSELNVIDVENLRVKAVLTDATIDAVETIEEAEMTAEDETTDVVETNVAGEIINVVETIVETIQTMIGNVENVRIPISHSELNVTAVAHLKAVAKEHHLQGTGKVMTEDLATGKQSKHLVQETGIARNVESLTLLREMTVSVVDVPRE
jgi:hypothetical protein